MREKQILKYLLKELSEEEEQKFEKWVFESRKNMQTFSDYKNAWSVAMAELNDQKVPVGANYRELINRIESKKDKSFRHFSKWLKYAAAIILFACITSVLVMQLSCPDSSTNQLTGLSEIEPGTKKAMLLLDNGRYIPLDNKSSGTISLDNKKEVAQFDNGEIVYNQENELNKGKINETVYNTLVIPRGGEFGLTLSDGTRIWLNSETEIRYPVEFSGDVRELHLVKGELYLEVSRKDKMAFVVFLKDSVKVRVLGTHFNINAYEDEPVIRITLLEGSVEISSGSVPFFILKPGEQSRINKDSGYNEIVRVNVEEVIAWKNGDFFFDNENLESIMKKLSRWYDVPFKFKDERLKQIQFFGIIKKQEKINAILEMLELTKAIEFKIVDGVIEVWPVRNKFINILNLNI